MDFYVHFSSSTPGYGFNISFDQNFSQTGCPGTDDGSGFASCPGSSGAVPAGITVKVTFHTPVGDCDAFYSALQGFSYGK
jgi:hypothetical protein